MRIDRRATAREQSIPYFIRRTRTPVADASRITCPLKEGEHLT
jgi:hypothetical protein